MRVDRSSPTPLYHQIAEAIRYRIATGELKAGARLESLKDAAERWGVNLHTVRRSYRELAEDGLLETRTPDGTRVLPSAGPRAPGSALRAFVDQVRLTARRDHGLSPAELAALISRWRSPSERSPHTVSLIECSLSQCTDLCRQVETTWYVEAIPWDLNRSGEPPPGPLLGTYFHFNSIRRRWPHRLGELYFVVIRPDPELRFALTAGESRAPTVVLVEREPAMAGNIEADLRAILPEVTRLRVEITSNPSDTLRSAAEDELLLFSPRVWGELSDADRADSRAREARYIIDADDLTAMAGQLGWPARSPTHEARQMDERRR